MVYNKDRRNAMDLAEAIKVWEGVFTGSVSRLDPRFLESIRQFGSAIECQKEDLASDVFVRSGLCSSKGDFKRSIGGLRINESPITSDMAIGTTVLLRRGKNSVVLAIVAE
jgi:tyrosyl-tRNA synthetase